MTHIRPAVESDLPAMRDIFNAVVATGDTLPFSSAMAPDVFHSHWFGAQRAYVAVDHAGVVGMYKVGANYPDLGSHIGSATYLVAPAAQGRGVGRALVSHSIGQAHEAGFIAMQFNYVVSTNRAAVTLYEKFGFHIAGTLPRAFRHAALGLVDACQPDGATACNCTACRRYGVLWAYDYENEGIKVTGPTKAFVRGTALEFHFCPECGCVAYWRGLRLDEQGRRRIAVNLRLAEPEAVAAVPIDHFDGFDTFDDLPRDGRCVRDYWF